VEDVNKFSSEAVANVILSAAIFNCGISILVSWIVLSEANKNRRSDEMFYIIPSTPFQSLVSYIGSPMIMSLYFNSFSLPLFVSYYVLVNGNFLIVLTPLLVFLVTQVFNLVIISVTAHVRTIVTVQSAGSESFLFMFTLFIIIFCLHYGIALISAGLADIFLSVSRFASIDLFNDEYFLFISKFILIPIIVLLYGIVAYRLCLNGFRPVFRTSLRKLVGVIFTYSILYVSCLIFYAVVAIIYLAFK
jgi:hypothetical protein